MTTNKIEDYFTNIVGYESVKRELYSLVYVLKNAEERQRLGIRTPRGLLLYGEPGLGKTTLANDIVNASGRYCVTFRKEKTNNKFNEALRDAFLEAKNNQPSIILLDDMDKYSNSDEDHQNTDEYVAIQACIDSFSKDEIFVIATANSLEMLPNSLLREGRFDRRLYIEYPNAFEASQIISAFLSSTQFDEDVDATEIAKIMSGRSCATLEAVVNEAGIQAISQDLKKINMKCMIDACLAIYYHSPEGSDYTDDKNAMQFAIHEAGHAFIQEMIHPGSVALVSTRTSSRDRQGITIFNNTTQLYTENDYMRTIMCALGGRAAVDVYFGEADPGATHDMMKAYQYAESLAHEIGINGIRAMRDYGQSENLKSRIEQESTAIVCQCYSDVKRIITKNRNKLEALAFQILNRHTLLGGDVRKIINEDV